MYVEARINGKLTKAMVDRGATHKSQRKRQRDWVGLRMAKESGWLKAVNSEARPIFGLARGVELRIGDWCGTVDLSVVPMDDFRVDGVPPGTGEGLCPL